MPDWLKAIIVGGLADVAALFVDKHDFNWSGEGITHLFVTFVGGAAAAFLILFKKGQPAAK